MAVTKKWDGIGVPNGNLTTSTAGSGDNVFNQVGLTPTVSNGSIVIPNISGVTFVRWNDLSLSAWSTRCYIQLNGDSAGSTHIIYAWSTTNVRMWSIGLNSGNQVQLRNAANSSVGTGPAMTVGVKYRFEIRGQSGTDSVTFKLFNASEVEIYSVTSAIGTTLGLLHVQYGRQSSVQFGPASYSNIQINNTNATIGAYTAPGQSSAPWVVLNSNGSTTALTLNGMWNGSSIVPLDIGQVTPIDTTPPPPPPTYRTPWQYPFASNSFWNTSVGSGATYLSTANQEHTELVDAGGSLNAADWSDPVYRATNSDPLVTVQHVEYLPAGWANLTNTQTGTTTGEGPFVKQYTNIRIPASATWQSNNNTDRKVLVVQPDGIDAIEMHKFYRTSNSALIFTTNLSRNDVRYSGLTQGAIASGISPMGGLIRNFEIAAAKAGDIHAISHILKVGLPNRKLIVGQRWPARTDDGDAETSYSGLTQYGTMIVLNKAVNIETLTYSGQPLVPEAKALAYALQDYGGYVLIRSGSGPVGLQVEARSVDATAVTNMKNVWSSVLVPLLRIVTNSANVGTLNADRTPVNPALIAGGGTRRRPALPEIHPTGPW